MARIELSEFVVIDNTTGAEIARYKCAISPHATKLGHVIYVPFGIFELSELYNKGVIVADEKAAGAVVRQAYGLSETAFTKRGMDWDTPALRARYSVFQNGTQVAPALSAKALARAEAKALKVSAVPPLVMPALTPEQPMAMPKVQITPVMAELPVVPTIAEMPTSIPQAEVMTDVKPAIIPVPDDSVYVNKIIAAKESGYPEAEVWKYLVKEYGADRATLLWQKAQVVLNTKATPQPQILVPQAPVAPQIPVPQAPAQTDAAPRIPLNL